MAAFPHEFGDIMRQPAAIRNCSPLANPFVFSDAAARIAATARAIGHLALRGAL